MTLNGSVLKVDVTLNGSVLKVDVTLNGSVKRLMGPRMAQS